MEQISFQGVNVAELLPRIPDSVKDGLPFGLVKLDLTGKILEYNMAEAELTGVSANWAIGKNFFDEVALCTKTQNFYGRFLEGVKKSFINTVFDHTFDHRDAPTRVKVHMVTIPDHLGQKNVMVLVKRNDRPVVVDATGQGDFVPASSPPSAAPYLPEPAAAAPAAQPGAQVANASIEDIVAAVMAVLNQGAAPVPAAPPQPVNQALSSGQASTPATGMASKPTASTSRHQDMWKF